MVSSNFQSFGNLRFAGRELTGIPVDPESEARRLADDLAAVGIASYGAPTLWFGQAPEPDQPLSGLAGFAICGLPTERGDWQVEDYHQLHALTRPHLGPRRDLPLVHRQLCTDASERGYRIRPYWWLRLRRRTLSDGTCHPLPEVAVFLDR